MQFWESSPPRCGSLPGISPAIHQATAGGTRAGKCANWTMHPAHSSIEPNHSGWAWPKIQTATTIPANAVPVAGNDEAEEITRRPNLPNEMS